MYIYFVMIHSILLSDCMQVKVVATAPGAHMLKHVAPRYDPVSTSDFRRITVLEDQDEWVGTLFAD